jgi:hypothetical protein
VARDGATGAAWAIVLVGGVMSLADFAIVCRILAIEARELAAHLWRPVLAAAGMGVVVGVLGASREATDTIHSLVALMGLAAVGAVVYAGLLLLAWRLSGAGLGAERHILATLAGVLPTRRQLGAS